MGDVLELINFDADGQELPPGSFLLITDEGHTVAQHLVLNPAPSADPNDPLNWAVSRKAINFFLVSVATVLIFTALSIQIIFWQLMTVDMDVTYSQLNNGVSANSAGLALGCAFFIPFAKKYGRRSPYVISLAVMAATAFWSARMTTATELYLTNLFQGLAGAINETIVEMTISDLFFVHQRGSMNALYLTAVMCGSFLCPIVAGVQAANQGWRASYYTLAAVNTAVWFAFVFFYEDTKFVQILNGLPPTNSDRGEPAIESGQGRSKEDKKIGSSCERIDTHINPDIPMASWRGRLRWTTPTSESLWKLFYVPFLVLVTFPHVIFTALQYAAAVMWLTIIATVLSIVLSAPPYNMNTAGIGYMNLGPFVGNLIGSIYGGFLGDYVVVFCSKRNRGFFEPEMRLYLMYPAAFAMSGGIIMLFVTLDKGMHWIYPSIGGAFFGFGLGCIGDQTLTIIIDSYRDLTGEAFVGIAFVRNVFGIGIPFAIVPWMNRMSLTNIGIVCGVLSLAIALLFIPLIYFGKKIRAWSAPRYYEILRKEKGLGA